MIARTLGGLLRPSAVPRTSSQTQTFSAALISRANPLSAILSHCQPTVSRTGASIDGVVHNKMTSRPMAGVRRVSGLHDHTRPSASVTVRVSTNPPRNEVRATALLYRDGQCPQMETAD